MWQSLQSSVELEKQPGTEPSKYATVTHICLASNVASAKISVLAHESNGLFVVLGLRQA
jgi:hypothetical protein